MWTGHGRALHQCQDTLNSSEQVAPMHSSSVVAVCKSAQCISPPIVLDCVPYIHFCLGTERHYWCNNLPARKRRRGSNRAQARYKTIERSVKTPIVQWRKCTICGTAMVLLWQNYGYGCCFFFFDDLGFWFAVGLMLCYGLLVGCFILRAFLHVLLQWHFLCRHNCLVLIMVTLFCVSLVRFFLMNRKTLTLLVYLCTYRHVPHSESLMNKIYKLAVLTVKH